MVEQVISGGQTGVDQAGLEVAHELGIKTGGLAPRYYKTEAGSNYSLRNKYGLLEDDSDRYTPRTEANAANSDGTVIFGDVTSAGTQVTIYFIDKHKKPYIVNPTPASLLTFLVSNKIKILNVAGNRGSKLTASKILDIKQVLREALTPSGMLVKDK